MSSVAQRSFSGGEIAPALYARVDQAKYAVGLRTLRNFFVMRHGGAANRPGTVYVADVKFPAKKVRFIEFVFNNDQTYVLEFGDLYMRVHRNGAQLCETGKTISGVTKASVGVVTATSHGFSDGDHVSVSGVVGMTELNGRVFVVANKTTHTFELKDLFGGNFNTSALTAYASGGTASRVYEIATPYLEADLPEIQFVQSADVVTLVHPSYAPMELSRTGHTSWALSAITFAPSQVAPTGITFGAGAAGAIMQRYRVTAIDLETMDESYVGSFATKAITGASKANPCMLSVDNHGYTDGDEVVISGVVGMTELNGMTCAVTGCQTLSAKNITGASKENPCYISSLNNGFVNGQKVTITGVVGMTELNGNTYTVTNAGSNGFALLGVNSSSYGTYVSGGTATRFSGFAISGIDSSAYGTYVSGGTTARSGFVAADPTSSAPHSISWTAAAGAGQYNVYKELNSVFGYIGTVSSTSFTDPGIPADTTESHPIERNPFVGAGNYPSTVSYSQQRLLLAATDNDPEKIWGSKTGAFKNFTISAPISDDDSITFSMAGRQVNRVRHLFEIANLMVLTQAGEWSVGGDASGILRPGEINPKQYASNGAATIRPLIVGGTALYVQARGSIIRDLGFDIQVDGYRGNDLTIFSAHLFDKFTLVDWAYQQSPHSIVWVVRSDGVLLGLTYIREHELWAWHRHDTQGGFVENVCVVPEGVEDAVYLIVRRTVDGHERRYVERVESRKFDDVKDAFFVDCGLTYDGRNTVDANTMTLSGGTEWDHTETLTMTSSAAFFAASDVGNSIQVTDEDGGVIRFTINGFTSSTVVTGKVNRDVPAGLRGAATAEWAKAVDEVGGLWHLEGEDVAVFADGFVVASPNNDRYSKLTVTGGKVSLGKAYSVIHVGLPITSDLETLDVDVAQGESLAGKKKLISTVKLFLEDSRGGFIGGRPPSDDDVDPLQNLVEIKMRADEGYDEPIALKTDVVEQVISGAWNSNGRVFVRQLDPLPLSVLAVIPDGLVPYGG